MRLIIVIIITLSLFGSCSKPEQVIIYGNKTTDHELIRNTNVLVKLFGNYTRTSSFNGFQDTREMWSISAKETDKSIDDLKSAYSEENLVKRNREFLEFKEIDYNKIYEGILIKYLENRRRKNRYLLALDLGDKRLLVQGWYRDYSGFDIQKKYEDILKSICILSEEEAKELNKKELSIPNKKFAFYNYPDDDFTFVGEKSNKHYYTKDGLYPTMSPDSSTIWFKPIWNTSPSKLRERSFQKHFGGKYEIIFLKKDEDKGIKSFEYWAAKSTENEKLVFGGFIWSSNPNIFEGYCYGNHEENIQGFEKIMSKIRFKR